MPLRVESLVTSAENGLEDAWGVTIWGNQSGWGTGIRTGLPPSNTTATNLEKNR